MPETLRRTGEIPTFDNYLEPAQEEPILGRSALPQAAPYAQPESTLNSTAERIGSAVGSAVGTVRRRLQVVPRRMDEAKGRLRETGGDVRDDIRAAAKDLKETAQHRLFEARVRARRYANEKPFQVVGAAAIAGFAIGVGLRIWRWKRE
jgi:ElaB/YqjD/DUF883 family membrane-anchored ribosome-binding protein